MARSRARPQYVCAALERARRTAGAAGGGGGGCGAPRALAPSIVALAVVNVASGGGAAACGGGGGDASANGPMTSLLGVAPSPDARQVRSSDGVSHKDCPP